MKKYHPAYFGVYLALALILSYVESLIPFYFGIPGVKLGLTNLVIVLVLYQLGFGPAMVLSCARVFLAGFLFGNLYSILYSRLFVCRNFQQPSPAQRAFTFCTAAATRSLMGCSGTPTI